MEVESRELPPIGTNAFIAANEATGSCVVIDAPLDAFRWSKAWADEKGYRIDALVLTHGHWDHILDAYHFNEAEIPVYGHDADRRMFEEPELMATYAMPGIDWRATRIDHWIGQGDRVELAGMPFEVRHVPGHCPGNVLLYSEAAACAFVGDAIFAGSVGRYDLPGGDFTELERSIREQIYSLPEATVIYPGHGPSTTVGAERQSNPFVRA